MRLYSARQVVLLSCILAVVALGVGAAAMRFATAGSSTRPIAVRNQSVQPSGAAAGSVVPVQYSAPSPSVLGEDEQNNIAIYQRVNQAVVYITSVTLEYDVFLQAVPQEGTGSGVIIDQDGHILTNRHVIKGADQLSVTLADGTELDAKVIGEDAENDLALLQIDPKGKTLTTMTFGSSSDLKIGQKVLAIGNPFGYDRTLTTGIVSGLARPLQTDDGYVIRETIQTDAAINPGNSGGPLLNSSGEMIGINTAILSPSGASAGVGFAIPVNTVKRVADELLKYGSVRRGWIEVDFVPVNAALARALRLPVQKGILVSVAGANASAAGIRGGSRDQALRMGRSVIYAGGDIITEVNGHPTPGYSEFLGALEDTKPGDSVTVKVLRGRQEKTFVVKLVERTGTE